MGIEYRVEDRIAIITFNRPEKLNALTLAMYRDLGLAFKRARDDDGVRVVILTGAGDRAFCVGADLKESIPALARNEITISSWDEAHLKGVGLYKPIICAINGLCLGGGFEIMLATDIRIASADARFALPEPKLGLVPAGGTLVRLKRQVAHAHAMELLLTARQFSAEKMKAFGIVNDVVPSEAVMGTALAWAREICELSATALSLIKQSVERLADLPLDEAFEQESRFGQIAFTSLDAKRGLVAFAAGQRARYE
ncbi:enoyl-CoA hydratase/isomerase family protein [Pelomonas sp. KK5]|uniref:enoyl-CoA hydratase/isomerase family protein n=1 Tax=Pelomonas sp. KK5 TaxID=1855730 RepID=UPI00097BD8B4|nr:enoyl-CoA hydratase-related protein [Pelomonas sp. KK5]